MPRKCLNHPDRFCFVESLRAKSNKGLSLMISRIFYLILFWLSHMIYFVCLLDDQDKNWAPHKICKKCCLDLHN